MWLLQKARGPYFHSIFVFKYKSTHEWIGYLSRHKKPYFRIFWGLFRPSWPVKTFFKNWALPLFLLYDSPTLCKKSEKTDEPFLRFCVAKWTDGWIDGDRWMGKEQTEPNSKDTSARAGVQKVVQSWKK